MNDQEVIAIVKRWVNTFVVGMNLCPFAKRELLNNRVRFVTTPSVNKEQLLTALQVELALLNKNPSIETTLLIHVNTLQNFYDYNDFLSLADALLVAMKLEGIYQIASFHPNYQFEGTKPEDAENYTNRCPYPMLHILREASLDKALANYFDIDKVPSQNIALMNKLGEKHLQSLLRACFSDNNG